MVLNVKNSLEHINHEKRVSKESDVDIAAKDDCVVIVQVDILTKETDSWYWNKTQLKILK